MSARQAIQRTAGRTFAAMLLSMVLGTPLAQAAPADGVAAGKSDVSVGAPAQTAPATVHMSPHARAARERAAAQAQPAASGIRVSAFTLKRKPHNHAGVR
jgi:hypothetical protein